jgi:hypothetical protein
MPTLGKAKPMTPLDIFSIILSVSSTAISVIAFFAAVYFFRHSVDLQKSSDNAINNMSEITRTIKSQIEQLFSKTLDAAIDNQSHFHELFMSINESLDKAGRQIEMTTKPILAIKSENPEDRNAIESVENALETAKSSVKDAQMSANVIFQRPATRRLTSSTTDTLKSQIAMEIRSSELGKTLEEISNHVNLPPDLIHSSIISLIQDGKIQILRQGNRVTYTSVNTDQ